MRIVAGGARGKRLSVPPGRDVRPTSDRVREALFSSLGESVRDARVLDAFAGSGALGLEALSRGAAKATFMEAGREALAAVRSNAAGPVFEGRCEILPGDSLTGARRLAKAGRNFDIILLDPPYVSDLLARMLEVIAAGRLLAPGGCIVAEHPRDVPPTLPPGFEFTRTRNYGNTSVSFIAKAEDSIRPSEESRTT